MTASNTSLNAVASSQFADCIAEPQEIGGIYQWYDKTTFAAPSSGRFGTCGTNSLSSGTFMQALGIANTGREGIDERSFRLSLRVGW